MVSRSPLDRSHLPQLDRAVQFCCLPGRLAPGETTTYDRNVRSRIGCQPYLSRILSSSKTSGVTRTFRPTSLLGLLFTISFNSLRHQLECVWTRTKICTKGLI